MYFYFHDLTKKMNYIGVNVCLHVVLYIFGSNVKYKKSKNNGSLFEMNQ